MSGARHRRKGDPIERELVARHLEIGTLERWLGEYDALFLRRDQADPMVVTAAFAALHLRNQRRRFGAEDVEINVVTAATEATRPRQMIAFCRVADLGQASRAGTAMSTQPDIP